MAQKFVIDLAPVGDDGTRLVDQNGDPLLPTSNYKNLELDEIRQKEKDEREMGEEDQRHRQNRQDRRDAIQRVKQKAKNDPDFADLALALGLNVDPTPGK